MEWLFFYAMLLLIPVAFFIGYGVAHCVFVDKRKDKRNGHS